jgi:hypothetical protein
VNDGAARQSIIIVARCAGTHRTIVAMRLMANRQMFSAVGGVGLLLASLGAVAQAPDVIESRFVPTELEMMADPTRAEWREVSPVLIERDMWGKPLAVRPTEVRSRWSRTHLYLLYSCPYEALNLKPDPDTSAKTARLWNWDVAEAFIGSPDEPIARYKEFQVSPQGEWIDLAIDRDNPQAQLGMKWSSGFAVSARIDPDTKTWYGLMRIPFEAVDARSPVEGHELRIGLYRISGTEPSRTYYAWRPTGQATFHVPQAFGTLRLR